MTPAERLRYLVLAAQREGNRHLARELAPLGLTPSQGEVLRILGDHAPLTLSGLGELLVCESGSNPSRLVDRLVSAGLVERVPGAVDRRQVTLTLTAAGGDAEARVRDIEAGLHGRIDAVLADAEVDGAALLDALQRLSAGAPAGLALEKRIRAGSPAV